MGIQENIGFVPPGGGGPWSVDETGSLKYNDIECQITLLSPSISKSHTVEDIRALATQLNQLHRGGISDTIQIKISDKNFEISKVTSLAQKTLSISSKTYETIVDDFLGKLAALGYKGDISKLKREIINDNKLDLNGNTLTSLPPEIGKLSNLQSLGLIDTALTSLP